MAQSSALRALEEIVQEIRAKGQYGDCRRNTEEYADWCAWIEEIKGRTLTLGSALSPSTVEAVQAVEYDWEDWFSVRAAVGRIHAFSHLIEDDIVSEESARKSVGNVKAFDTVLHRYVQKSSVGSGGAGNVYLVEREDGVSFALKLLNKQSCGNSKKVKRFLQEIAFCEHHPELPLVEVVDRGFRIRDDIKQPFYVMTAYGRNLRQLMNDPHVDRPEVLSLLLDLMERLRGFYDAGHVHRDIKPENILFDESRNQLILADFGVAHIGEKFPELTLQTVSSERLANFRYAAPEQREIGGNVDHRTDQYAFGLLVNEIFTGVVPQGFDYPRIAEASEGFSYLDPVVDRMISQNRDSRYESVSVLLADIVARERIKGIGEKSLVAEAVSRKTTDIAIIGKEWVEPDLIFRLNAKPEEKWKEIFRSHSYDSFDTDGFCMGPKYFVVNDDAIIVSKTRGDKDHIAEVCRAMPGFIDWANEMMEKRIQKEEREERARLVRIREEEDRKRENSAEINSFLATL